MLLGYTHTFLFEPFKRLFIGVLCFLERCFALAKGCASLLPDPFEDLDVDFDCEEVLVDEPPNHYKLYLRCLGNHMGAIISLFFNESHEKLY